MFLGSIWPWLWSWRVGTWLLKWSAFAELQQLHLSRSPDPYLSFISSLDYCHHYFWRRFGNCSWYRTRLARLLSQVLRLKQVNLHWFHICFYVQFKMQARHFTSQVLWAQKIYWAACSSMICLSSEVLCRCSSASSIFICRFHSHLGYSIRFQWQN